jgi:uncharacterized membrane protein YedE/YeeE
MKRLIIFIIGGIVFGVGLALSGMAKPEVVQSFLLLDDFGLMLVMGGAILVTMPIYQLSRKPILAEKPESFSAWLNPRTILGSVLFGVGWGVAGVCPGAAIASLGLGNAPILVAIAAMFVGAYLQGRLMAE